MHPELLAMAIKAISSNITLEGFQTKPRFGERRTRSVLDYLIKNGIGKISQHSYTFSKGDIMKLAILVLRSGIDIETVSTYLSWQDFETFASNLLDLSGYSAECDLHFSKPTRMQIDVLGINYSSRLAIVVDCKHWKRSDLSTISYYAKKQSERTTKLLIHRRKILHAIPIILTLHSMDIKFVDGVPLIPVAKFSSFIEEVPLHLSEVKVISRI